jgi:hypothetical protein
MFFLAYGIARSTEICVAIKLKNLNNYSILTSFIHSNACVPILGLRVLLEILQIIGYYN